MTTRHLWIYITLIAFGVFLIPQTANAMSCKKIDKIYAEQFGRADFNQAMKPHSIGSFKKENSAAAIDGINQILKDDRLTPKAISTAYEEISKIHSRNGDKSNAVIALQAAIDANGFPDKRNAYLQLKISRIESGFDYEAAFKRIDSSVGLPVWPRKFKKSGHCVASHNVTAEGIPINTAIIYCTDDKLAEATIEAANKNRYHPIDPANSDLLSREIFFTAKLKDYEPKCKVFKPE